MMSCGCLFCTVNDSNSKADLETLELLLNLSPLCLEAALVINDYETWKGFQNCADASF